jgi:hypothetical protein
MPWDTAGPRPALAEWAIGLDGHGLRAIVVGVGLGQNSEFIAGLGFDTLAFDISPTAIDVIRQRFPQSTVEYLVADLLDPPAIVDERLRPRGRGVHRTGTARVSARAGHRCRGRLHGPGRYAHCRRPGPLRRRTRTAESALAADPGADRRVRRRWAHVRAGRAAQRPLVAGRVPPTRLTS